MGAIPDSKNVGQWMGPIWQAQLGESLIMLIGIGVDFVGQPGRAPQQKLRWGRRLRTEILPEIPQRKQNF